jgi:hypothetical protein
MMALLLPGVVHKMAVVGCHLMALKMMIPRIVRWVLASMLGSKMTLLLSSVVPHLAVFAGQLMALMMAYADWWQAKDEKDSFIINAI